MHVFPLDLIVFPLRFNKFLPVLLDLIGVAGHFILEIRDEQVLVQWMQPCWVMVQVRLPFIRLLLGGTLVKNYFSQLFLQATHLFLKQENLFF